MAMKICSNYITKSVENRNSDSMADTYIFMRISEESKFGFYGRYIYIFRDGSSIKSDWCI